MTGAADGNKDIQAAEEIWAFFFRLR